MSDAGPTEWGADRGAANETQLGATSATRQPHVVVLSSLFPSEQQPNAGIFIKERLFRLRGKFKLTVVSPVPWFPLQRLIRVFRPGFRPVTSRREDMEGVEVYRPRFLSIPGACKWLDGTSMALCSLPLVRRLRKRSGLNLIDAHFAYPDGYAAARLGSWLGLPVTITLRGTEARLARMPRFRQLVRSAADRATRIIAVSSSLKELAVSLGVVDSKIRVIGNGVDLSKFSRLPRGQCREQLELGRDAKVLISVGGLTERKGFHRVIDCLPELIKQWPDLVYLVVGGASAEGDWELRLKAQVAQLGLEKNVRFCGPMQPPELKVPLSAADVFVLATSNEGWANVFLEAMACGLPVVTTDVGGNTEVVNDAALGTIVPFGDQAGLQVAIREALTHDWDRDAIVHYAERNTWDERIEALEEELRFAMSAGMHTDVIGAPIGRAEVHPAREGH